jgi:chemotaxis protein MotB
MIPGPPSNLYRSNNRGWIVTFADLVALLLTFFVMLFSMSAVDAKNWQALRHSVSGFRQVGAGMLPPPDAGGERGLASFERHGAAPLDYLAPQIRAIAAATPDLDLLGVFRLPDRLVVSLGSQSLVDASGAGLSEAGRQSLGEVARRLANAGNRIEIGAHMAPAETFAKADSFGRSFERANAVAEALRAAGYGGTISALGLSSGQSQDVAPSLPQELQNRLQTRIDLTIRPFSGN